MNTLVARIHRVLAAGSPTAMLQAVDEHGHELRLEVPSELARGVAEGHVLVLQWSAHGLPRPALDMSIEVEALHEEPPPSELSLARHAAPHDEPAAQLETLLGLRPGRLRGTG